MEENLQNEGMDTQVTNTIDTNPTDTLDNPAGDNSGNDNTNIDNSGNDTTVNTFNIPQEYQEKDWAKNFEGKTGDELQNAIFKALDEKYANTPVIPETVEAYELNTIEFKDEDGNPYYEYPPEVLEHFGNEFKDLGLTKEQAHGILTKYTSFELEQFQALTNVDELNKNIDDMFKSNPAQKQTVQGLLKEFLPAEDQKFLQETAPNYTIEMFYKVAKGLVDKYGYKEGSGGQAGKNNYVMSQADKDKEYNKICDEMEALKTRPHTTEEKDALQRRLNALFG